jgi:hypothetical protein
MTPRQHFEQQHREFVELCREYANVAPPDFRFSDVTAARLIGIPLPPRLANRPGLDVTVSFSKQRPRMRGVIGHRMRQLPSAVMKDGLPILPPEWVWLQLAKLLSVDELIVAGDHLVRRKSPASTMEKLAVALRRFGRRPGAITAHSAVVDIRPGTDSPRETQMRLVLVRAGLPEPVIGWEVHDDDGFFVGTPDGAYVDERIALDFEGDDHRTDVRTFRNDIERREQFEDADWRYVRVTSDHLERPHRFIGRVQNLLARREGRSRLHLRRDSA